MCPDTRRCLHCPSLHPSGTAGTEAGGDYFRLGEISEPGEPLQSGLAAPAQRRAPRKLSTAPSPGFNTLVLLPRLNNGEAAEMREEPEEADGALC